MHKLEKYFQHVHKSRNHNGCTAHVLLNQLTLDIFIQNLDNVFNK